MAHWRGGGGGWRAGGAPGITTQSGTCQSNCWQISMAAVFWPSSLRLRTAAPPTVAPPAPQQWRPCHVSAAPQLRHQGKQPAPSSAAVVNNSARKTSGRQLLHDAQRRCGV